MTIEVLSQWGRLPILVGDADELADFLAVDVGGDGRVGLAMSTRAGRQTVPLTPEAAVNFLAADHLLLVGLCPSGRIVSARRVRAADASQGEALADDLVGALADALSPGPSGHRFEDKAVAAFWSKHPALGY